MALYADLEAHVWNFKETNLSCKDVEILALHFLCDIQELVLTDNSIQAAGNRALALALGDNTTLRTLTITSVEMGQEGAKNIAEALKNNSTLWELIIGNPAPSNYQWHRRRNNVGDKGALAFAAALWSDGTPLFRSEPRFSGTPKSCCSKRVAQIKDTGIGILGHQALNALLQQNHTTCSIIDPRLTVFQLNGSQ
jgi:hypothetical protein